MKCLECGDEMWPECGPFCDPCMKVGEEKNRLRKLAKQEADDG